MSSLALTSGWYYICTSYCTPDSSAEEISHQHELACHQQDSEVQNELLVRKTKEILALCWQEKQSNDGYYDYIQYKNLNPDTINEKTTSVFTCSRSILEKT